METSKLMTSLGTRERQALNLQFEPKDVKMRFRTHLVAINASQWSDIRET